LYRDVQLSDGSVITLRCWGEVYRRKYAAALLQFIISFGKSVEHGTVDEDEFGDAFDKLDKVLELSIVKSDVDPDFQSLPFGDKMTLAGEVWELNQVGGDGIPKIMSLYQEMIRKTIEAYQKDQLAKMSKSQ